MITIGLSLLVALVGLFFYFVSSNVKVQEISRLAFAVGLLVFLLQAQEVVNLLG